MGAFDRYYAELELEPGASSQEVRRAYRRLAKVWHPDSVARHPTLRRRSEEKMKRINEAYEMLKDLRPTPPPEPPRPEPRPRPRTEPKPEPETEPETERETEQETAIGPLGPQVKARSRGRRAAPGSPVLRIVSVGKVAIAFTASIAVMLAYFFVNQPTEHPYYTLARMVVFCSCLYACAYCLLLRYEELMLILLPIAIVFNPLLPISISFEEWFLLNSIVPILLIYVVFALHLRSLGSP